MNPTDSDIGKAFGKAYGGDVNFMTPSFHSFGYSLANPDLYFEISVGTGIFSRWMVGCTVVSNKGVAIHDLSTSFSGDNKYNLISKAREYGESLEWSHKQ